MENILQHVGILGMKWGRRKATSGPDRFSADHKTSSVLKKKKLSELSNDELKALTTRLSLEKQFKDLTKQDVTAGQKFMSDVLAGAGKQLASKYVANIGESAISTVSQLFRNK